jgi:hypothetical protein
MDFVFCTCMSKASCDVNSLRQVFSLTLGVAQQIQTLARQKLAPTPQDVEAPRLNAAGTRKATSANGRGPSVHSTPKDILMETLGERPIPPGPSHNLFLVCRKPPKGVVRLKIKSYTQPPDVGALGYLARRPCAEVTNLDVVRAFCRNLVRYAQHRNGRCMSSCAESWRSACPTSSHGPLSMRVPCMQNAMSGSLSVEERQKPENAIPQLLKLTPVMIPIQSIG